MYKILLVDDETIFRKGLHTMISALDTEGVWEIAGEARDGYEALEQLETNTYHVLLTDIRMPKMDGIQLQNIVRERFPEMLSIVISGYDEFSYVQQSLRMGVKDYLLKPVERQHLAKVLQNLKDELGKKSDRHPLAHQEENIIRQHVSEHLATRVLRGNVHESDLALLRRNGVDFSKPYYTCLVIKLDKDSVESERYRRADPSLFLLYLQQVTREILTKTTNAFSFILSNTEVVAIINTHGDGEIELLQVAETIRKEIKQLSNITVTIGVGRTVEGINSIPKTYNEAVIVLLYRLIYGGNRVLYYSRVLEEKYTETEYKKWSWEELEQSINAGRTEETIRRVKTIITELCGRMQHPETIHQQICKLIIYYYELAEELKMTQEWLDDKDIRTILLDVCSVSSREELIEECEQLLGILTQCIAKRHDQVKGDPIMKAIRFLELHYHEPITLKDIADRVFLNPAYFSTMFKQKTGKSFIEKLTEIRIDEAKRRLTYTDHKIAGLAEAIGFTNLRHFNRVFKKETGFSPKDYKEYVRNRPMNKS